jgi:hypothetical protein
MGDAAPPGGKGQRSTVAEGSPGSNDRLMTTARDHVSKADSITIAAIEAGVPTLVDARTLTDRFHRKIRRRTEADLVP